MRLHRGLATLVVGTVAATTATFAPAHAASGWKNVLSYQGGKAQACATVNADGTATVRVRLDNRKGGLRLAATIVDERNGKAYRTLVATKYVTGGKVSAPAETTKIGAAERFYVDIAQKWDEGAGAVKTSSAFVVSEMKAC